ncbi:DUF2188 domain-containing protein [Patescibacteria group bacterium]|nr:DUF2188 domain-containing protein [Patescibacteria group bacterium]MBU1256115.1 DUF2188 domain-containing protein [Patescibacteria group bacterium]MBU1457195.1 DUF2188 domain-containing protein [Patescibacteria group bacterium]
MKKLKINLKQTDKVLAYNGALKRATRINHVVKYQNGWAVKKNGAQRVSGIFNDQGTAIDSASKMARNDRSSVVIHGRDGKIRDVRRFN